MVVNIPLPNNKSRIGELTFGELMDYEKTLLDIKEDTDDVDLIRQIDKELGNINVVKEIVKKIQADKATETEFLKRVNQAKGN